MPVPERQDKPALPDFSEPPSKTEQCLDRKIKVVRKTTELVWELKELAIALIILWVLIKHAGPLF